MRMRCYRRIRTQETDTHMVDFEELRQRMTRAQRRGTHGTAAKDIMLLLAVACLIASAVYWWRVQSSLTSDKLIAGTFTAILTIAPPVLLSFCIPWSPGGMLLQKVNARTWGMMAVVAAAVYLLYYSFQLQWAWWSAQPQAAESGLIYQQVFVGMIGYIFIPALLWTPVSSEELEEKLKQAQLVKRYELQTQADIAILRTLGLTPAQVMRVFMVQGSLIGVIGTVVGVIGGIVLTLNLGAILKGIEHIFGIQLLPEDVYYITGLPIDLQSGDVVTIACVALAMAFLATLYPAWRAARTAPAEALRYE